LGQLWLPLTVGNPLGHRVETQWAAELVLVWRQTLKIRGQVSYWWMPWFRHNQTSEFSIKNVSEFDVIKNV
jgi:hypothetical protein